MPSNFGFNPQIARTTLLPSAADAAGRTSATFFRVLQGHMAWIEYYINQGNAATILCTPLQGTSNAGAGATALTIPCRIWFCTNDALGASDQALRQTDALNFTTDVGVHVKRVLFGIDPADINLAGGFAFLGCSTGASNVANITTAVGFLTPLRYSSDPPQTIIV